MKLLLDENLSRRLVPFSNTIFQAVLKWCCWGLNLQMTHKFGKLPKIKAL